MSEPTPSDPFSAAEIDRLSLEIDAQLRELGAPGTGLARGGSARDDREAPIKYVRYIA